MTISLYISIEQKLSEIQYRILFSKYLLTLLCRLINVCIGCKFIFYLGKYLEEVSNVRFWDPKRACPPMEVHLLHYIIMVKTMSLVCIMLSCISLACIGPIA